jgi:hypothetical protein
MNTPKRRGRPPGTGKLTPAVVERICQALRKGCTWSVAATSAGVSPKTVHAWRQKGQEASGGIFRDFYDQTSAAEREAFQALEQTLIRTALGGLVVTEKKVVTKGGEIVEEVLTTKTTPADGRLLLQILERRDFQGWGKRSDAPAWADEPLRVSLFGKVGFGTGDMEIPDDAVKVVYVTASEEEEREIAAMNDNILPAPED